MATDHSAIEPLSRRRPLRPLAQAPAIEDEIVLRHLRQAGIAVGVAPSRFANSRRLRSVSTLECTVMDKGAVHQRRFSLRAMTRLACRLGHWCSVRALAVSGLALTAALLAASGEVSYTDSDPRGTLLTAQAILEHGTFALDSYADALSGYQVMTRRGHRFYAYPPGTPIAALPAVAIARLAGLDMTRAEDDHTVQRALAAISVGLTAVLASSLAVRWLPWPLAVTLAGILVFGTPVMSTMGTALWSTNLTVVATLAALVLLSKCDISSRPGRAAVIGALLGFACWCRPTAILLAGLVILWQCGGAAMSPATGRRSATISALALSAAVAMPLALLIPMSWLTYGTWLPDYYIGTRLAANDRVGTALMAHLVSPSRGLLIFAPAVVPALAVAVLSPRRVLHVPFAALALVWVCIHLAVVSRFFVWWGGYSYGCRLLVEVLPGVFVFSCAAAAAVRSRARHWRVLSLLALVAAGVAGVWINSVQGLFNSATATWNASPSIDRFPGYAFDWRLPQFQATKGRLNDRLRRHNRWLRAPLDPDTEYTAQSTRLQFLDWSTVEDVRESPIRRSIDRTASVRFLIGEGMLQGTERMMLTLCVGAERPLAGQVWFNGQPVADLAIGGRGPEYYVIGIPRVLVRTIEYNVLESNVLEWRGMLSREDAPILLRALRVHAAGRHPS